MTDIDRPSTWVRYQRGMCEGCRAGCCTLPLEVTAEDLLGMGLVGVDEISGSLKKVARRLIAAGTVRYFRAATGLFTLQQKANRDCLFLDASRRCLIYEKRPTVCRSFPDIGPRPGYCPRQSK